MKRTNKKACLAVMLLLPCMACGQQRLTLDHLLRLADSPIRRHRSYMIPWRLVGMALGKYYKVSN